MTSYSLKSSLFIPSSWFISSLQKVRGSCHVCHLCFFASSGRLRAVRHTNRMARNGYSRRQDISSVRIVTLNESARSIAADGPQAYDRKNTAATLLHCYTWRCMLFLEFLVYRHFWTLVWKLSVCKHSRYSNIIKHSSVHPSPLKWWLQIKLWK